MVHTVKIFYTHAIFYNHTIKHDSYVTENVDYLEEDTMKIRLKTSWFQVPQDTAKGQNLT